MMMVLLIIGILVDTVFGQLELSIRHRRGLAPNKPAFGFLFTFLRTR
jgi:hypothetical protein